MIDLHLLARSIYEPKHIAEVGVNGPKHCSLTEFFRRGDYERALLIEPHPGAVAELRGRFGGLPGVRVEQCAIVDSPGDVEMYDCGQSSYVDGLPSSPTLANDQFRPKHGKKFSVAGRLFSDFDDGTIDLLAADVEGSEWFVIKHMKSRPHIIRLETHLAFHPYQNPYLKEIREWMRHNYYDILFSGVADTVWIRRAAPVKFM